MLHLCTVIYVYLRECLSPLTSHFADLDFTPNFFKENHKKLSIDSRSNTLCLSQRWKDSRAIVVAEFDQQETLLWQGVRPPQDSDPAFNSTPLPLHSDPAFNPDLWPQPGSAWGRLSQTHPQGQRGVSGQVLLGVSTMIQLLLWSTLASSYFIKHNKPDTLIRQHATSNQHYLNIYLLLLLHDQRYSLD